MHKFRSHAKIELKRLALAAIAQGRLDDAAKIMHLVEYGDNLPRNIFILELNYWRAVERDIA